MTMKTRFFVTIMTALMFSSMMSAQDIQSKSQIAHFVINGHIVDTFDGSQLAGEKIRSYSYDQDNNIHIIYTNSYKKGEEEMKLDTYMAVAAIKERAQFELDSNGLFIVLNGNPVSASKIDIQGLSDIEKLTVIKDKSNPTFVKYADIAKAYTNQPVQGIMVIATKHFYLDAFAVPAEVSRKSHAWIIRKGLLPRRAKK